VSDSSTQLKTFTTPLLAGYALMIAATVAGYLAIRSYGETLAPAPAELTAAVRAASAHGRIDTLLHVLLALVVVIVAARALGLLFRQIHQPPVVGEIIAGIMLGPSILGRLAPSAWHYLLPPSVAPFLGVLSEVGIVLYMFLVGLELDPGLLRRRGHTAVAISHASIIAPFLMGAILAVFIFPSLAPAGVSFTTFSLFLGVSMSVTAFPVLARILTDRQIHKTRMGAIALTCAAVDDLTAWCLLAFVVGVAQARALGSLMTFAMALGYLAVLLFVIRPAMVRLTLVYGNRGRLTQGVLAVVFVALLLSSVATDMIGLHAIFGAFALGAVIPHDSGLARELTDRLEDIVVVLLLPAFFAFTGLRTEIGLLNGTGAWLICALIILVASAGKFGGSAIAAALTGLSWRDSFALGILMNTRGLMELIVLNIALELNIISPALFAMLVLMALVTTFATTPILHFITRGEMTEERAGSRSAAASRRARGPILVPISNPVGVTGLVAVAAAATGPEDSPPHVLALVRRPSGGVRSGLRELEERVAPRSGVLLSAVEYAQGRGSVIVPEAIWTDGPAHDILRRAQELEAGWILMGFHRPAFGVDSMGGVVGRVLERARSLPIHVGVVTAARLQALERVFAAVDRTADGEAALDLAGRIAYANNCSLHAVLVPGNGGEPEPELLEIIRRASRVSGRWLHTDVLSTQTASQLISQARGQIVIIGAKLADELRFPINNESDTDRCLVLVQSGRAGA
jgi:Kef-type K+ transport system membrane component KefB